MRKERSLVLMNRHAEDKDMNIFSPDPYDRDAARARSDLAALSARVDTQADQRRSPRRRRDSDRDDTIAFWRSSRLWQSSRLARIARGLRAGWHEQVEAQERLAIINRPWIHENAHWHELSDGSMVLHGEQVPSGRRAIPVTAGGWGPTVDPGLDPARIQVGRRAERIIRPADRLT
jgi:hypothetical protein